MSATKKITKADVLASVQLYLQGEISYRAETVAKWTADMAQSLANVEGDTDYLVRWSEAPLLAAAGITTLRRVVARLNHGETVPALVDSLRRQLLTDATYLTSSDGVRGLAEREDVRVRAKLVEMLESRAVAWTAAEGEG
jgi:hypothetical protein